MAKKENNIKIKKNKNQDKKKAPFNLKEWIKMVLERSSSKRSKVPKISATFNFIVVEVEKNKGKQAVDVMKKMGSKVNIELFGHKETSEELKLLAIQENEIEMVLSLMPIDSDNVQENLCEKICDLLKSDGVEGATVYAIKPSSADLNLIYLVRKGV